VGASRCRHPCPPWCRSDHGSEAAVEHRGSHLWLNAAFDGVTANVGLVGFADDGDDPTSQPLVCLRLRQRDLADKDSVELSPAEARHLAALLIEAADSAGPKWSIPPAPQQHADLTGKATKLVT
jgi:hypothetical protein